MNLWQVKPELERLIREKRWSELQDHLALLAPPDIAIVLIEVPDEEDVAIFRLLPKEFASQVFAYLPLEHQQNLIHTLSSEQMRSVLAGMTPDDQAALLDELPAAVTRKLMQELSHAAAVYRRAGGIHTGALAEGEKLLCMAEDVGRHNALDKIAGACLRRGQPMRDRVLLTTGRVSSEMVSKAARMGIPIVISRTSPTSLSIQLAHAWGITLIGYTRRRSFRVYTHAERVVAAGECTET